MGKSRCAVVIPVYKHHLTVFEHESIQRTVAVLSKNHDIFYVCPQSLFLNDEYSTEHPVTPERFDDCYFESTDTYTILCESTDFYKRFMDLGYEWMLICQPDAWIFHDRLEEFMSMDYDYFGGPHWDMGPWNGYHNGNGGLSLRRLSVFMDICTNESFKELVTDTIVPEDVAFTYYKKHLLRLAPVDVCFQFSIQQPKMDSDYLKDIFRLPMGTHQPHNTAIWSSIWSRYIPIGSGDINKEWKIMSWNKEEEKFTLVVVPYNGQRKQGNEIRLAVTGWRRYFKENHKIVIIGEDLPYELEAKDLICIHSKRVYPIECMYTQHLDYISCFKKVKELFPNHEGFIFAADDNYPVNDFTLDDIKVLKCNAKSIIWDENAEAGTWNYDRNRTLDILNATDNKVVDYTTHFPCWFEFEKVIQLARVFNLERESYVLEDLYFNIYHCDEKPVVLNNDTDKYRYFVTNRQQAAPEKISRAFETKKFICNSEQGWSRTLEGYLIQHYTGQSGLQQ